jgi:hypothetical protein
MRLTSGKEFFETNALVVYVSPGLGMGVRFQEDIPQKQLDILDRWLSEAARNL